MLIYQKVKLILLLIQMRKARITAIPINNKMRYTFYIILFFGICAHSQEDLHNDDLDQKVVSLIDDIYYNLDSETCLRTDFFHFKGIEIFLKNPELLRYGLTYSNDSDCRDKGFHIYFTNKELNFLISLNSNTEKDGSFFADQFPSKADCRQNAKEYWQISKPLIVNDKAVYYLKMNNSESIIFAQKEENKWKVKCRTFIFSITEN